MNRIFTHHIILLFVLLLGFQFSKAQSLQLTSPNGGEVWQGGTVQNITWTYTNVDNIKIEYSLNNGLNWTILAASYPASSLSYAWTVPCIGSTQAKVRITSTLLFTQDESNAVFTIPQPVVDITYPNGGESFVAGTGQYIEWTSSGLSTIKVQYTTNNGSSWSDIGNFSATDNYCNWVVPTNVSSQARIRAYNVESPINRDSSATSFNITAAPIADDNKFHGGNFDGYNMCSNLPDSINILTPNGGEVYDPTNTIEIKWNYRHIDNIKIEYSINNGLTWNLIVTDIPASILKYNWTLPNIPSNQCKIKISGLRNNVFDETDNVFTIRPAFVQILYPNNGEDFGTGTGQYIEWDYRSVSTVKLEYSTNDGASWSIIGTAPAADRYANWVVPSAASGNCLLRISDNTTPSVNDLTDSTLSIYTLPESNNDKFHGGINDGYSMNSTLPDSIHITSPNGGEILLANSVQTITWTSNEIDNVKVEYSIDNGFTWNTIVSSMPANISHVDWIVPSAVSVQCLIKVSSLNNSIQDLSDSMFTINTGFVHLSYPIGGERFGIGTGQYIEWDYNAVTTVNLEYSVNGGSSWTTVGTAAAADRYANWVAPSLPTNNFLFRISDVGNAMVSDQSNADIIIYQTDSEDNNKYHGGINDGYSMYNFRDEYVHVLQPNGAEIWATGSTQQIRWSKLNNNENIKIEYSTDNEASWNTIASNLPNEPDSISWTITDTATSAICKVRITTMSGLVVDKSDDFFTIANPVGIITDSLNQSGLVAGNITGREQSASNLTNNETYCSGATTSVNFTINNNFNLGNRFIVQLSDSSGSFDGPLINIGEINAIIPQPINVTFPVLYYESSHYRLRVVGTNPPTIGTDNGENFSIGPLPVVHLGKDTSICSGTSITLQITDNSNSYAWNTGSIGQTLNINQAGTYWVAATNACGTRRDSIVVRALQLPSVNLGNDRLICLNSSLVLNAGNSDYQYVWNNGVVGNQITIVTPGTYAVTASNACGSVSDEIVIGTRPRAVVDLGEDRIICPGQNTILNAGNPGAIFRWSNGNTSQQIQVNTPGSYSVNVNDGCDIVYDRITLYNGGFQISAGPDKNICKGQSTTLNAIGSDNFIWNTGQTSSTIPVSPQSTTTYTVQSTNDFGCVATDRIIVNVIPVRRSTRIYSCSEYNWYDTVYASNGTYTHQYVNSLGCNSIDTLILTIDSTFVVDTIVGPRNACAFMGNNGIVANYSVNTIGANTINWSFPVNTIILSGLGTNNIQVKFPTTFSSGTISVQVFGPCGLPITRSISVTKTLPAIPTSITGDNGALPITNVCTSINNGIVNYYAQAPSTNGSSVLSYHWTLPSGASIVRANTPDSSSITIQYSAIPNPLYLKVKAISGCAVSSDKTLALTTTLPTAPALLSPNPNPTNACLFINSNDTSIFKVRKSINTSYYNWVLPAGISIISHPNGLGINDTILKVSINDSFISSTPIKVQAISGCGVGSFTSILISKTNSPTPGIISGPLDVCNYAGTNESFSYTIRKTINTIRYKWILPLGMYIDSSYGLQQNDTIIRVKVSSTFNSGIISVQGENGCGLSLARTLTVYKRAASQPVAMQQEFIPSVPANIKVCGVDTSIYRIKKSLYASGYIWSLSQGSNATIIRLNPSGINDTATYVKFLPGFTKDTISVRSFNACSVSAPRTLIISALNIPPTVSAINGNVSPCVGQVIAYSATTLLPTTTQGNVSVYRWTKPNNTTILSANSDSSTINISFNTGFTGGTITAKAQTACGVFGSSKTITLKYLPPTPSAISSANGLYTACVGDSNNFTVVMPAPSTTQIIAAVYRWTIPKFTIISSAAADSQNISLRFLNGFTGGIISAKGQTSCGVLGIAKSQTLTLSACPTFTKYSNNDVYIGVTTSFDVNIFPNPTKSAFNLQVSSTSREAFSVKVLDVQGRLIKSMAVFASEINNIGNDLKSGVYMFEITQGKEKKTVRGVRY